MYYNGPGTFSIEDPKASGRVYCTNDEELTLVEIIDQINQEFVKAGGGAGNLAILLTHDCCGAGGQYHDICDALKNNDV